MTLIYHANKDLPVRSTIAAKVINYIMYFSVARCSKKDQFNKKIGRNISTGRLNSESYFMSTELSDDINIVRKFREEAAQVAEYLIENKVVNTQPVF